MHWKNAQKLTADINAKKVELKSSEKETKEAFDALAELQKKFTYTNNKLAECQITNTRLSEFNSQLYELVKGSSLAGRLEKEHANDKAEQNKVYDEKAESENNVSNDKPPSNEVNKQTKIDRKCWFHENGYGQKNPCNYLHPTVICVNYSRYGSCSEGNKCRLRHPLKVCMKFLEGSCNQGDSCVTQHPMNQMSSGPRPASIVTPYMSPPLLPHPPQSSTEVPYPVPAFPSQTYHEGPPYPRSKSSSFSEFKSSTPPGPTNLYAPKQDFW